VPAPPGAQQQRPQQQRPQQDSNLRTRLRRAVLYPLSYGGWRDRPQARCLQDRSQGTSRKYPRTQDRSARITHAKPGNLTRVTQGLGRVLVVDDDEVIRQLIAVNLTLEGFDVTTAVDGSDCLEKVVAANPDVITLDVMMPRLDGWVTATQLRRNPETAGIKVVLITARAQEDDRDRGRQIGVDAYLTKPFDPAEMIRVVRELAGAPSSIFD
jgi:CheY-like chemotaxis protein